PRAEWKDDITPTIPPLLEHLAIPSSEPHFRPPESVAHLTKARREGRDEASLLFMGARASTERRRLYRAAAEKRSPLRGHRLKRFVHRLVDGSRHARPPIT